MQNLLEDLTKLLGKDNRCIDKDGQPLKNKVIELALKLDADLLKLLLSNKSIKKHFFADVDGVLVFDKIKFQHFVSNKEFLPDSYTAFKNKIGLTNENGSLISDSKEVVLAWPYKDCVLEGGQDKEDVKRDEVFWNETLAPDEIDRLLYPKALTNFKRYDSKGEHKLDKFNRNGKGDIAENLIIKGNNLLAMHSLKHEFAGKVKLIYLDPPYNTGNDSFNYNDSFNHSTWLTFMMNRIETAKDMLRNDGVIFVQIDGRELSHLKVLMDELFLRDNFLCTITVKAKAGGGVGQESYLFDVCEYILVYAKNKDLANNYLPFMKTELRENTTNVYNNIFKSFGKARQIKEINAGIVGAIKVFNHENFQLMRLPEKDRTQENYFKHFDSIFRTTNPQGGLMQKILPQIPKKGLISIEYIPSKGRAAGKTHTLYFIDGALVVWLKDSATKDDNEEKIYKLVKNDNLWIENLHQGIANEGNVELKAGKKPERLIHRIIEIATEQRDVVLDSYVGSGTTASVAHKTGRQYIGIEQIDYHDNDCVHRLNNVIKGDATGISKDVDWKGGGSFVYCELAKHNEVFAGQIMKAKTSKELKALWKEMQGEAFLSYKVDIKTINENIDDFDKLTLADQKRFLLEVLDKNMLYVNYCDIDDKSYKISEYDKKMNRNFYGDKK